MIFLRRDVEGALSGKLLLICKDPVQVTIIRMQIYTLFIIVRHQSNYYSVKKAYNFWNISVLLSRSS